MTRYGFAIKALPPGGKPFGEEDDENDETMGTEKASLDEANPGGSEPTDDFADDFPEEPNAAPAMPAEDPAAAPQGTDAPSEGEAGQAPEAPPTPPDDDSRPWAGDMYDEGNETDPDSAYSAYSGVDGEQAWLDRGPDGTLTGWVRDSTGQVWRYTDPDAWSTDVDGAQMTRTHGPDGEDSPPEPGGSGQPPAEDRGAQEPLFAGQ
ncbi:hypothetical protein ABTY59_31670 [Streptomyces sp. NPDC096079]|uniref:hypothetical protein n=1 Tax=Streptomyces sp. NPDC096079 TaxID=3155820 RepID=UPI00332CCBD8